MYHDENFFVVMTELDIKGGNPVSAKKNRSSNRSLNGLVLMLALFLVGAAIRDQLRRPPEERTWQGRVFGFPYDFRIPTVDRIRDTMWNKDTSQILMPHAFGVGWSINFYPLLHPASRS